jgi:hypothetical protein
VHPIAAFDPDSTVAFAPIARGSVSFDSRPTQSHTRLA